MTLYRSSDYQINWPFDSGEVLNKIAAMAAILDF